MARLPDPDGTGELDLTTAPELRIALGAAIAAAPAGIIVDVGNLDFVDASGLGALTAGAARNATRPDRLHLAGPSTQSRRIVMIADLRRQLPVHPTYLAASNVAADPQPSPEP